MSDVKGQVRLQTSVEFVRAYNAQAYEMVDAITAAVTSAQAGLTWLRAVPPDAAWSSYSGAVTWIGPAHSAPS